MGTRVKTFVSTGIAPDGRLFAGDLNAMEDQYADLSNLLQTLGVGTIQVGETGLQIIRYGAGEMRVSGHMRTDGILRGLGGLYAGAFTTTQRDAIALGLRPYGLVILNTTTNRLEINIGTDPTPIWQGLGAGSVTRGTLGTRPGAGSSNTNSFYFATDDNGGTLYYSDGSVWTKIARGLTEAPVAHQASHVAGGSDALPWITIIGLGTLAARPTAAATNAGYLYFANDVSGGTLYRSFATGWDQIAVSLADSRLTNARTPTAHASTHGLGGSDVLDFTTVVGTAGLLAARPGAATRAGQFYFATDDRGGSLFRSDGSAWSQVALSVSGTPTIANGTITSAMIADNTIVDADLAPDTLTARVIAADSIGQSELAPNAVGAAEIIDGSVGNAELATDAVTQIKMADNSVGSAEIIDGSVGAAEIADGSVGTAELGAGVVTNVKIAAGHGGAGDISGTFPTSGLFNGYEHTIFLSASTGNGANQLISGVGFKCVYRADIDGTYPWIVLGQAEFSLYFTAAFQIDGISLAAYIYAPRNGLYLPGMEASGTSGSGGGIGFAIFISSLSGYDVNNPTGNNNWFGWSRSGILHGMTGGTHYVQAGLYSSSSSAANYDGMMKLRPVRLI